MMKRMAPQDQDGPEGGLAASASQSLTLSLQEIAEKAGSRIDRDDLNAVLGLSWSAAAVPSENDPSCWPMYARDAFLVESGRLFGLSIRPVHPPEAARGLRGAAEFRQHFDASYRPLVRRAIEHDQPVLAWRGWPGEYEMMWGVITGTGHEGAGLTGRLPRGVHSGGRRADRVTLMQVPVQLYVVETVSPTRPDPDALLTTALDHAARVLGDELVDRFGVLTGPDAYDLWIARIQASSEDDSGGVRLVEGHRRLAASTIAGQQSTVRFLESRIRDARCEQQSLLQALGRTGQAGIRALEAFLQPPMLDQPAASARNETGMVEPLRRARDSIKETLCALRERVHIGATG